jgi:hypothetical protein
MKPATMTVLPAWFGPSNDSFIDAPPDHHVSAFSWLAGLLDILSALAFATAGALAPRVRKSL